MQINWKARLQNKTFVISAAALLVSLVYKILSAFEIVPAITENEILEVVSMAVDILAIMGVVVDPTTAGVNDSNRAMTYCTEEYDDMKGFEE